MRTATLLAAAVLAIAFSSSDRAAAQAANPNTSTMKLMSDAFNPYGATMQPAAPAKHMRKHKRK